MTTSTEQSGAKLPVGGEGSPAGATHEGSKEYNSPSKSETGVAGDGAGHGAGPQPGQTPESASAVKGGSVAKFYEEHRKLLKTHLADFHANKKLAAHHGKKAKYKIALTLYEGYIIAEKARESDENYDELLRAYGKTSKKGERKQDPAFLVAYNEFNKSDPTLSIYGKVFQLAHEGAGNLGRPMTPEELLNKLLGIGYRRFYDDNKQKTTSPASSTPAPATAQTSSTQSSAPSRPATPPAAPSSNNSNTTEAKPDLLAAMALRAGWTQTLTESTPRNSGARASGSKAADLGTINLRGAEFQNGSGEVVTRSRWGSNGVGVVVEIISFTTDDGATVNTGNQGNYNLSDNDEESDDDCILELDLGGDLSDLKDELIKEAQELPPFRPPRGRSAGSSLHSGLSDLGSEIDQETDTESDPAAASEDESRHDIGGDHFESAAAPAAEPVADQGGRSEDDSEELRANAPPAGQPSPIADTASLGNLQEQAAGADIVSAAAPPPSIDDNAVSAAIQKSAEGPAQPPADTPTRSILCGSLRCWIDEAVRRMVEADGVTHEVLFVGDPAEDGSRRVYVIIETAEGPFRAAIGTLPASAPADPWATPEPDPEKDPPPAAAMPVATDDRSGVDEAADQGALQHNLPPDNTPTGSLFRAPTREQAFGYTSSGALTYWFDGKPHLVDNVTVRSDGYKHINVRDYLDREAGENYPDGSYYISTAAALPPDFPIPPLSIVTDDDGGDDDGPGGGSQNGQGPGQSEGTDKPQLGAAPSPPATRGHGRHPDDHGPGGAHPRRPESPPNGDPGVEARPSTRSADVSALIRCGRPEFYQSRPYLPRSEIATLALSASPTTYPFPWLGDNRVRRVDLSLRPQSVEHYVRAGRANWQIVTAVVTDTVIQIIDVFEELAPLGRQDEAPGNNRGGGKNWRIIARWLAGDGILTLRIKVLGRTDACRDIIVADSIATGVDLIDGLTAVEGDAEALVAELRRAFGVTDLPFKAARDVEFKGPGITLQLSQFGVEIHRGCDDHGSISNQGALPHLGVLRNQRRHWEFGRTRTPSAPVQLAGAPRDGSDSPIVTPESK